MVEAGSLLRVFLGMCTEVEVETIAAFQTSLFLRIFLLLLWGGEFCRVLVDRSTPPPHVNPQTASQAAFGGARSPQPPPLLKPQFWGTSHAKHKRIWMNTGEDRKGCVLLIQPAVSVQWVRWRLAGLLGCAARNSNRDPSQTSDRF